MRFIIALLFLVGLATPTAWSQTKPPSSAASAASGPKLLGKYGDWRVATGIEAGATICYAYTSAQKSVPDMPGRNQVTLTVTQRSQGPRDAVAVSPGFTYAPNAAVSAAVDGVATDFYTATTTPRSAFARDGRAAVQAFLKAKLVVVRSPNPKGHDVAQTFSLNGFNAAYAAINKACPAK